MVIANVIGSIVGPVLAWSARFTDFRLGLVVAAVITDDNMVVEWREPLRYPDLH